VALALVVSLSRVPPVTDLPQHLAQIRLLDEMLGFAPHVERPDTYRINWNAPNNLVYVPMWLVSRVLAPIAAGKVTVWLLAVSWLAAILALAYRRRGDLGQALLASVFLFNVTFYWGFLNFLCGLPLFLIWLMFVGPDEPLPRSRRGKILLAVLALLLFAAHVFWFVAAAVWMGLSRGWAVLRRREPSSSLAVGAGILLPTAALAAQWYPQLRRSRVSGMFDVKAQWVSMPWSRLWPEHLVDSLLGGLVGWVEPVVLVAVLLWIAAALVTNRRTLRDGLDWRLLAASAMGWVVLLFAPDKYMNTMLFAQRWGSVAAILLVLALPRPQLPKALAVFPAVVFAGLLLATAIAWHRFDAEADGFDDALAAIHAPSRLIWLPFGTSQVVKPPPFLQVGAYAQALHGCELSFTFAEHGSGIVVIDGKRKITWTPGLEWEPKRVRRSDVKQFDLLMVEGPEVVQAQTPSILPVKPLTTRGGIRLFARQEAVAPPSAGSLAR
jgi:hypothetical protein